MIVCQVWHSHPVSKSLVSDHTGLDSGIRKDSVCMAIALVIWTDYYQSIVVCTVKVTVDSFDNSDLLGMSARSLWDMDPLQPDYSLLSGCNISVVAFDQKNLTYHDPYFY